MHRRRVGVADRLTLTLEPGLYTLLKGSMSDRLVVCIACIACVAFVSCAAHDTRDRRVEVEHYTPLEAGIFKVLLNTYNMMPTDAAVRHYTAIATRRGMRMDKIAELISADVDEAMGDGDGEIDLDDWDVRDRRRAVGSAKRVIGDSDPTFSKYDSPKKLFDKCRAKCADTSDCKSYSAYKPRSKAGRCTLFSENTGIERANDRHQAGFLKEKVKVEVSKGGRSK